MLCNNILQIVVDNVVVVVAGPPNASLGEVKWTVVLQ